MDCSHPVSPTLRCSVESAATLLCADTIDVPAGIRGTSLSVESLAGAAQDGPTGHGFYEEIHDNMMSLSRNIGQFRPAKSAFWTFAKVEVLISTLFSWPARPRAWPYTFIDIRARVTSSTTPGESLLPSIHVYR
jgi:hypothetical protein